MLKKIKDIDSKRFFMNCPSVLNKMGVYVWGDAIILLPFLLGIFVISFFSVRFALLILAVFFSIRSLGEIVFWMFQQFSDRSYRPHDFGFCNLDNHGVYIFYQLIQTINATISITALIIFILYWEVLPETYGEVYEIVKSLTS